MESPPGSAWQPWDALLHVDQGTQNLTLADKGMGENFSGVAALAVLNGVPTAVIVLNQLFECEYANAAAEVLTGVNAAEIVGRSIWETFPALQGSVLDTQVRRAVSEGKKIPFEFHYEATDRWCDVEATPMTDGIALYLMDVTERRRAVERTNSQAR